MASASRSNSRYGMNQTGLPASAALCRIRAYTPGVPNTRSHCSANCGLASCWPVSTLLTYGCWKCIS